MKKNLMLVVLTIALAFGMSACNSGKVEKVYNSCGDITTCVNNTPNQYNKQIAPELQELNNKLFGNH